MLFQVYMLSLAFADIDCLFSPNQGITLPIKKEELKYLASFLFLLDSTKYLEVFYSFTEDKTGKKSTKKVFLKLQNCKSLLTSISGFFGHELGISLSNFLHATTFFSLSFKFSSLFFNKNENNKKFKNRKSLLTSIRRVFGHELTKKKDMNFSLSTFLLIIQMVFSIF